MIDPNLKIDLEKASTELEKTTDVEGILIVAVDGRILHHNIRVDVDINLFGPMSQVISSSSLRLLNSSGQGDMERVLVESSGGKALFLGLESVHLIILMQSSANVGMVMVNAKRASERINELTHDLELEVVEEVPVEEVPAEEIPVEETTTPEIPVEETTTPEIPVEETTTPEIPVEETTTPEIPVEEVSAEEIKAQEEIAEAPAEPSTEIPAEPVKELEEVKPELEEVKPELEEVKPELEEVKPELEEVKPEIETVKEEPAEAKPPIPTVKPPISFPKLPELVEVPDDTEKRSDLILDIYEYIFLAMSLGAAKIMGVAPARGLTKKFLPFEKCQRLLHNVDLKSNATIDFNQIKKNAGEIPVGEREKIFIQDFNAMIDIITENYGRVMGYEAFRAMVRPEFLAINKSYGDAMEKLGIKSKLNPEIAALFR